MFANHSHQSNTFRILEEKFKVLSHQLCSILAGEGIRSQGYKPGLPYFSSLSDQQKQFSIDKLQFYIELCIEQNAEGYSLKDSPTFMWRALKRIGYVPTSDIFSEIQEDHVIEIYSKDSVQIFRNLNFFKFCSYTFEEILCIEWWNLYSRSEEMSDRIYQATCKIFQEGCVEKFNPDVPSHIVQETQSADCLSMEFSMELISPLFVNKTAEAVMCLERVRLINS